MPLKIVELIEKWERAAEKCDNRAELESNGYTAERLYAAADTFCLCANQLRQELGIDNVTKNS